MLGVSWFPMFGAWLRVWVDIGLWVGGFVVLADLLWFRLVLGRFGGFWRAWMDFSTKPPQAAALRPLCTKFGSLRPLQSPRKHEEASGKTMKNACCAASHAETHVVLAACYLQDTVFVSN